jgi:hypothetical protein
MPPSRYTMVHPDAKLSAAERERLMAALETMDEGDDNEGDGGGSGRGRNRGRGGGD